MTMTQRYEMSYWLIAKKKNQVNINIYYMLYYM